MRSNHNQPERSCALGLHHIVPHATYSSLPPTWRGRKFAEVGPIVDEVVVLDIKAARVENGKAYGEIVLVDPAAA